MSRSELHNDLTKRALVWLHTRATNSGIRSTVEVFIREGYIADAVGIARLNLSHEIKLIGDIGNDYQTPDYAFIFETKVTRTDFFATFRHEKHLSSRMIPAGHLHFVVTPPRLVKPQEVPEPWGLLEQRGNGLSLIKQPVFHKLKLEELYKIAYTMLRARRIKYTLDHIALTENYVLAQSQTDIELTSDLRDSSQITDIEEK